LDDRKGAAAKEQAAEIEGLDEAERELLLEAIDDLATGGARTDLAASRFKCLMKRALWRSYVGLLRALRLMRKLLRKQGFVPKLLVTDKLRSYGSAFRSYS
jgi:hypothetical protein